MSLTSSGKLSTRITADLPDSLDSPDSFTVKRRGKTVVDRGLDDPGTLEPPATTHPAMPDLGSAPLVLSSVAKTLVDRGEIQRSASNTTLVSNDDNHTTTTYDADVIIVGAGVVGASLASALARPNQPNAGLDRIPRRVLLIERSFAQPDRIVGELLQPGGVQALAQLGLHHVLADPPHSPQELNNTELADSISLENDVIDAVDCKGYAVFYKGEPVLLPYPNGQLGKSFHHGRFISNLRNECLLYPPPNHTEKEEAKRVDKGWIRCVEATVTGLEMGVTDRVTGVWASSSTSSDSTLYRAPIVVVCDGLYSRFRSTVTPTAPLPTVSSQFCGFILKDLALPYNEHGHVFLCDPSPVLMYRVSKSDTRVLVDLSEKKSGKALVDYLVNVVGPQLPLAVSEKFEIGARTQRLRQMPNSLLASTRGALKGVVHVGDARNMRHPLTGVILADLLGSTCLYDENAVDEALGQVHLLRQSSANVNILADALYGLFSAQDPATLLLQQACFRYFQRGGTCVSTPVRLLAGLESSVWLLVYHFIWVAIGAVALALHQYNLVLAVQVVICAVQVGLPHLLSQYQY